MKKLKHKELNDTLKDLKFKTPRQDLPLDKHQKVCVILGIAYKTMAFWLDMGLGKSRVALELLNYFHKKGMFHTAIILAPSEPVLIGWENQIREWKIKMPYLTLLKSSSRDKWDNVAEFDGGLIMATYPGLVRMVTKKKLTGKGKRKKNRLVINNTLVNRLSKTVGAIVFDEITKASNAKGKRKGSIIFRVCRRITKIAKIRYGLAGRPFGRNPMDLWGQLYLIDRGETLGETLGMYQAAFFTNNPGHFGGIDRQFKKELKPKLNKILRHRSITYSEEECGIKRPVINILEEIELPDEAQAYYEQFAKQLKMQYAGFREKKNAFIRMRQISSGFVGFLDDETGDKAEISFATNPKLDRLLELVELVPNKRKFVIFHEFTHSGNEICRSLKEMGIKYVRGWSGTKDARVFQDRFDNDDTIDGAVMNHKWGGYGTNMQRANYSFVFEAPVPVIDNEQMRKRLPRKGQLHTVFDYDLVCRGTMDYRILKFHQQGEDLFQAIIRDPAGALNG